MISQLNCGINTIRSACLDTVAKTNVYSKSNSPVEYRKHDSVMSVVDVCTCMYLLNTKFGVVLMIIQQGYGFSSCDFIFS